VTPEQKSALLTTAAPDRSAHQFGTPAAVRQRAGEVMTAVPFPAKRNSGAALNWEHQGPLTEAEVQRLVQVNAMCDWLRQAVEEFEAGALSPTARRVVSDIPRWSMLRGLPFKRGAGGGGDGNGGRGRYPAHEGAEVLRAPQEGVAVRVGDGDGLAACKSPLAIRRGSDPPPPAFRDTVAGISSGSLTRIEPHEHQQLHDHAVSARRQPVALALHRA